MGRAHNRDRSDGYWFLAIGARDRGLKASPLSLPDPSMRFWRSSAAYRLGVLNPSPYAYLKAVSLVLAMQVVTGHFAYCAVPTKQGTEAFRGDCLQDGF